MVVNEIHVGDSGTSFEITIQESGAAIDISTATIKDVTFKSPSGVITTKSLSFVTDGTDGKVKYTTTASDLTEEGQWYIQARIAMSGSDHRTDIQSFVVFKNL